MSSLRRRFPRPLGGALVALGVLAPLGLVACERGVQAAGELGAPASVVGTTLDARTGEVLVGVLVEGPRASRAVSDTRGRFQLLGLREGDSGPLRASRGQEFRGELPLRPLRPGSLEVVFHLRPPTD